MIINNLSFNQQQKIEKYDYELFKGVFDNNVKKVREMIDCGCDINCKENDKGTAPIHIAASRGHKQVLELLVSRGCDVNVQDERGTTPLHSLVQSRYDILALWLIRQGALFLKDKHGFSPLDLAQNWFKKEMIDVAQGRVSQTEITLQEIEHEQQIKQQEYNAHVKSIVQQQHDEEKKSPNRYFITQNAQGQNINLPIGYENTIKGVQGSGSEILKIYFKNDSYKSIKVRHYDDVKTIIRVMCEKINMKSFDKCFDLIEIIKGEHRFLNPNELLLDAKSKWPIILTRDGFETNNFCHFSLVIKKSASINAVNAFKNLI